MMLKGYWKDTATPNTNVEELFANFRLLLDSRALSEWETVLETKQDPKSWLNFKTLVSHFITRKVLPVDGYEKQRRYLERRKLPNGMEFKLYFQRLQTLNTYLPLMLDLDGVRKLSDNSSQTSTAVWVYGQIGQRKMKEILYDAVPMTWCEILPVQAKTALHIANLVEQEWLRRYPRPRRAIFDQGGEFDNQHFRRLLQRWMSIRPEPITVKNPRANAVVERLHRAMGDMWGAAKEKVFEPVHRLDFLSDSLTSAHPKPENDLW